MEKAIEVFMASRWWDPGDLGVCGEFSSTEGFGLAGWKVVWILRWLRLRRDKGIRKRLRNHGILGDLLVILILIKTVSQRREGNMSGDCQSTDLGFVMEIGGINYRLVSIKVSGIFVWVFGFYQSLPGIVMVKSFHRCYALPWNYYIRVIGVSYYL
uniref:Transmembrane protein n=1 Tax=Brassica campestris TaxID=3711 RepID=M4DF08_BRACM